MNERVLVHKAPGNGWDLVVGRLGPARSRAMAGPRPVGEVHSPEPQDRGPAPQSISVLQCTTTDYFLDYTSATPSSSWHGGAPYMGGLRRRRASDTGPPPFLPRPGMGNAATRELALIGEWRHAARSPCSAPAKGAGSCSEAAPGWDLVQSPRAAWAYAARERNASAHAAGERRQPVGAWF